MTIPAADSSLAAIVKKVRRLTASASESALSTNDIYLAINTYYSQDFPYGVKIDQMRSVYTFFTEPYRDRYPLDVNYDQGVRAPFYVEGIQGSFFKDRQQFYGLWPRFPTLFNVNPGTSGNITAITNANPASITSAAHGLTSGQTVTINGVVGMTQLNGNTYTITVINANTFTLNVDSTGFGAYVSGGTWTQTQIFNYIAPGPILSREVVLGGQDINGNPISVNDDGNGNMLFISPNPVVIVPSQTNQPGMYNLNTANPGLQIKTKIGTVNYVTGLISLNFTLAPGGGVTPAPSQNMTLWVSQYTTGRPISCLFWNNEFTIRPVPKLIHKCEVETFLTPVQFLNTSDVPILNQWWQCLAYGVAREILRERQDMAGVANLEEGFKRQEGLVLERQGVEELFIPNQTIFNSVSSYSCGPWGNIGSENV